METWQSTSLKLEIKKATVSFCRKANASLDTKSSKESILTRLHQRLSGEAPVPVKKKPLAGNANAKKKKDRWVELGWMDFNEKDKRYKQVKAINGGGMRHLAIDKDKTVVEIKKN